MRNMDLKKICLCAVSGIFIAVLSTVNVKAGTFCSGRYYPDSCDLSNCPHSDNIHFYATGETYVAPDEEICAEGVAYKTNGEIDTIYETGVFGYTAVRITGFQEGWFYYDGALNNIYKCDGNHVKPDEPKAASTKPVENVIVDHDSFKSEAPSKTVIASNTLGVKSLFDLKVHAADDRTKANQAFLVQNYIGANAKILLTENIYPRRDLSTTENGSLQTLTLNNLPKNQAGPVYAVVYNQTDKAYVISGTLDANGTAVFTGFKLRPASTITICR